MDTKAVIGVVVAVVVVGGGAWYLSTQKAPGEQGAENTGAETQQAGGGTFAELVGRAGSWRCEVTTSIEEAPSEGVAYIAGGKVRADFTSTPEATGQPVTSHMIHADGYVYTWSDMYPQGMKMLIPEGSESTENTSSGSVSYDSRVDYDCAMWTADASLFAPPSSVTFMELGVDGMPQGIPVPY